MSLRRIRWRRPFRPAIGAGQHIDTFARGRREHVLRHHHVRIGFADQLAGTPIEDEYPADLSRLGSRWNRFPVLMDVEQHHIADGVVIPHVMLDLLVVPLELSAVHIEGNDTIGV